jgi:hypothetical protein
MGAVVTCEVYKGWYLQLWGVSKKKNANSNSGLY